MTAVVETLELGNPNGATVMVKDTIDVAGCVTRAGCQALDSAAAATEHADVVQKLLSDGWKIIAKTSLHELAFGTTGINHWSGTPRNPRFPSLVPGGSSSGSAVAVASGLCDAALGTDTGGSIRTPAACCGVFGLKPTFGRVSRQGVMPAVSSLDCVGPLARDMDSLTRVMSSLCDDFAALPALPDLPTERPVLGVVAVTASAEVQAAVDMALHSSGFALQPVELPGMAAAYDAGLNVINRETWNACGHLLATGKVGDDVARRLLLAGATTDEQLQHAEAVRQAFAAEVDALLAQTPILALPTLPEIPPHLDDAADTRALLGMTRLVRPFNLSGHPAISLPLLSANGDPVGLQLVAARGADEWLCAVASAIASCCAAVTSQH